MNDQNEKSAGYRNQSQSEIDAMNEVNALANQAGALIAKLMVWQDTDKYMLALAKTNFEKGVMWTTRSIIESDAR
jgi:hypothetical protein